MTQSFNAKLIFILKYILLPLAIAKLLWSAALPFLDKGVIPNASTKNYSYHYYLNLGNKIIGETIPEIPTRVEEDDGEKLDDIKLKGTYLGGDASFIIIDDGGESKFIYIGEKFRGYELVKVGERKVVFEKNGKNYYVLLNDEDEELSSGFSHKSPKQHTNSGESASTQKSVKRDLINDYIKHPNKIWNNIRIQERRKNGVLDGFRVNYVKKGSFFDRVGLKSGDIIKEIDGNPIESLADVMRYYNNVDSLESLSLTVQRGDEDVELDFSIN